MAKYNVLIMFKVVQSETGTSCVKAHNQLQFQSKSKRKFRVSHVPCFHWMQHQDNIWDMSKMCNNPSLSTFFLSWWHVGHWPTCVRFWTVYSCFFKGKRHRCTLLVTSLAACFMDHHDQVGLSPCATPILAFYKYKFKKQPCPATSCWLVKLVH